MKQIKRGDLSVARGELRSPRYKEVAYHSAPY